MDKNFESLFFDLWQKIIGYLPNLLGGILLLLLGWLIGWMIKRIVIQLLLILRFDRLFLRLKWKSSLSKADIRYALYNMIGNFFFIIIFLIFLNSALEALQLHIISKLIEQGVLFIPRLFIAAFIIGFGWIITARTSTAVFHALIKENFPSYSIVARFTKFVMLLFFSAMALIELDIAREIVLIGFGSIIITLCLFFILIAWGSRNEIKNFIMNKNS